MQSLHLQSAKIPANGVQKVGFGNRWQLTLERKMPPFAPDFRKGDSFTAAP